MQQVISDESKMGEKKELIRTEDKNGSQQQGLNPSSLLDNTEEKHMTKSSEKKQDDTKTQQRRHPPWANQPLPWKKSVAIANSKSNYNEIEEEGQHNLQDEIPLLYMPFLEDQMKHLQILEKEERKTTLDLDGQILDSIVEEHNLPPHYVNKLSDKKAARVGSKCFAVKDMFRKIRMTYVDAGETLQVLNSVWYPEYQFDLPILGIDLLYFGKSKIITVIDFQPLSQKKEYTKKYIDPLKPIKEKYPLLQGKISNRYYEDTRWFSEGMLFSRMESEDDIMKVLFPAYKEYMSMYTDMMKNVKETEAVLNTIMSPEEKKIKEDWIKAKHDEYDEYNRFEILQEKCSKLILEKNGQMIIWPTFYLKTVRKESIHMLKDMTKCNIIYDTLVDKNEEDNKN